MMNQGMYMKMWMKYKKSFLVSFLLFIFIFLFSACGQGTTNQGENPQSGVNQEAQFPLKIVDGRNKEVTIPKKPTRIVSTSLATDEFLFSLVDPSRIVAVTEISTDEGISNVAGKTTSIPNKIKTVTAEQIIALKPDLVLLPTYIDPGVVEQLDKAGMPIFQLKDQASFQGIQDNVRLIAKLVGETQKGEDVIKEFNQELSAIDEKVKSIPSNKRVKVLYWTNYGSSVTAKTTVGEMIVRAGGVNVISEAGLVGTEYPDYPKISKETVLSLNPDVIITDGYGAQDSGFVDKWKKDPSLKSVNAFKNNRVFVLNSAHLTNASHYVVKGTKDIFTTLYPELNK